VEQPDQRQHVSATTRGRWLRPYTCLLCLLVASTLRAQDTSTGLNALPGVHEVPLATPAAAGVVLRGAASYGWTEPVLKTDDKHHRMQLDAAASVTPLPWLSAAVRVLGRYDVHSGSDADSDYGIVTQTHLGARATLPLGEHFRAGAELELWLPAGDSVSKAFAAVSGDLRLLFAYAPPASPLSLGVALGLRLDRTRYAGGEPERYSPADRLGLGVSDSLAAAWPGLAFAYRSGSVHWLAEWSYRMYFDYVGESPMWVRAGARYFPSDQLQLELLLGVSPSQRPSLDPAAPLAVIEPRLWAGLALTYAWTRAAPPPVAAAPPEPEPELAPPPLAKLAGQVLAAGGAALPGANVRLTASDSDDKHEVTTDEQGKFAFAELPGAEYQLVVTAEGFQAHERSLLLQPGATPELAIALTQELPIGQIRGTVRRFDGKPIVARVVISALQIDQKTGDDGSFEIDVPPGDYAVVVSADRFKRQTRTAHVEQRGVAILIIELEPGR
jgi:hypothetical protein